MPKIYFSEKENEIIKFTRKFTLYNILTVGFTYIIIWGKILFNDIKIIVSLLINKGILAYLLFFVKIYLLGLIAVILGIIIHELIHAIIFGLFSKNRFKSIQFGFKKEPLLFYVHCKERINLWPFRTGLIMPGLILGLVPTLIGLLSGNILLTIYGIIFTSGAAGDIMVFLATKGLNRSQKVKDLPDQIGFEVID